MGLGLWARWFGDRRAGRFYGGSDTLHRSEILNVEVDPDGRVCAVWYRCQMLPFRQADVPAERADEMRATPGAPRLVGVRVSP
jgi:hypothetical protein